MTKQNTELVSDCCSSKIYANDYRDVIFTSPKIRCSKCGCVCNAFMQNFISQEILNSMTNEQQERQSSENKVKEYIERAKILSKETVYLTDADSIFNIAQMLQREEHFNKSKEVE